MSERAKLAKCQARLAALWLGGGGLLFGLVLIQSIGGKYGEQASVAWSWLLPAIIPTLSLIIGAVAYDATKPNRDITVNRMAYRIAAGLSAFYLLLLFAVLLTEPLVAAGPLQLLEQSRLWTGPVQGLVGLALGAFFVSGES